jgi:hypothetical protein
VGEVKWTIEKDPERLMVSLLDKVRNLPLSGDRRIFHALWLKGSRKPLKGTGAVFTPADVVPTLR